MSPTSSSPTLIMLLIAFSICVIITSPSSAASRHLPNNLRKTGFKATLRHVDSGRNLTRLELLQRATQRSRNRLEKLYAMTGLSPSGPSAVESPIRSGSGEYLMDLSIGTPPQPYSAILDTGSDLIWTQCKPCKRCYAQSTPIFDPRSSTSFSALPCSSDLCDSLPISSCGTEGECAYLYAYGDYSSTEGVVGLETFKFGEVSVGGIGFGCGLENDGGGFSQGGGLVGLGRGPLSLVSQLDEPKFSYCLTSIDSDETSTLSMGSLVDTTKGDSMLTTPLIRNPNSPSFYYLSLHGITVGERRLPIEKSTFRIRSDGSGGTIIDSGTTITYLEGKAFDLLKEEFADQMNLPVDDDDQTGLELCFKLPSNAKSIEVPKIVFHFEGADLDLPGENYFVADRSGVGCLAMGSSSGMSIFGNFQQQNFLVFHDLVEETVSFVPAYASSRLLQSFMLTNSSSSQRVFLPIL